MDARVKEFSTYLAALPKDQRDAEISRAKMLAMNAADGSAFERKWLLDQRDESIADLVRDGVPPPTFLPSPSLGEDLFYENTLFTFNGHKKAGKSWAMKLLSRDVMNAGRPVVYVDNENGHNLVARRLRTIGAKHETVALRAYYVPFPKLPAVDDLQEEFEHIAETLPGALVVMDSLRTFMAKYRLDPNKDVDVEAFLGPIMAAVKAQGSQMTVGVIDHANRTTKSGDQYAAGGAAAKAQAVDNTYYFDKIEPFSVFEQGVVSIDAVDDREGLLDFKRFYRVGGQGKGRPLYWKPADASSVGILGALMRNVWQFLADLDEKPQTKTDIRKPANTGKGGNATKDEALQSLVDNPDVPIYTVPGKTEKMPVKYVCDVDRWETEHGCEFSNENMEF